MNPNTPEASADDHTAANANRSDETRTAPRAANALKHGFSAARFINPETLALADSIQADLVRTHQPQPGAEAEVIAALARAQAQFQEIELARQVRISHERATALERFDRCAADALERDKSAWRNDPVSRLPLLAGTFTGASFLNEVWARICAELNAGRTLPFDVVCDAVMALGSPWQVDKATGAGLQLLTWYVRCAPDPELAAEIWAKSSRVRDGLAFARDRVSILVADAPDAAAARSEIIALANRESGKWTTRTRELRPTHDSARETAPLCAVGLGFGDPDLEKSLRLLHRYATSARNEASRLQRRLDALLRDRATAARRAARNAPAQSSDKNIAYSCEEYLYDDISKQRPGTGEQGFGLRTEPVRYSLTVSAIEAEIEAPDRNAAPRTDRSNTTQPMNRKDVATRFRNETDGPVIAAPDAPDSGTNATGPGPELLTTVEMLRIAGIHDMSDPVRRQQEILKHYGSEERFHEVLARMQAQRRARGR